MRTKLEMVEGLGGCCEGFSTSEGMFRNFAASSPSFLIKFLEDMMKTRALEPKWKAIGKCSNSCKKSKNRKSK